MQWNNMTWKILQFAYLHVVVLRVTTIYVELWCSPYKLYNIFPCLLLAYIFHSLSSSFRNQLNIFVHVAYFILYYLTLILLHNIEDTCRFNLLYLACDIFFKCDISNIFLKVFILIWLWIFLAGLGKFFISYCNGTQLCWGVTQFDKICGL